MNKKDILSITPVKNYTPPKLPTLAAANLPLKTLPARWKKNAAVVACLGFAGALTLAGCAGVAGILDERFHNGGAPQAPFYIACPTENEVNFHNGGDGPMPFYVACPTENNVLNGNYFAEYPTKQEIFTQVLAQFETSELNLRTHWGGSGTGPYYVAHFTEQEVLGFIRAKLEAAGLNLDAVPPEHTIFGDGEARIGAVSEMGIDLFDAENNIAITSISWEDSTMPFSPHGRELADMVADEFSKQSRDISFGVFYNPGEIVGWGPFEWLEDDDNYQETTPEKKEEARFILIERLTAQVDEFIAWLRAEGIV